MADSLFFGAGAITAGIGGAGSIVTSSLTEVSLQPVKLSAGIVGPNGRVVVFFQMKYTGVNAAKHMVIRLSTTSGDTSAGFAFVNVTNYSAVGLALEAYRGFVNANSASSQVAHDPTAGSLGLSANAVSTGAINTANDSWININGLVSNAGDTAQLLHYAVLVIPGA